MRKPGPKPEEARQGRRPRTASREFLAELESLSRGIRDPVTKLRYLRGSLSRYEHLDQKVEKVAGSVPRRLLYRWLGLESLRHAARGPRARAGSPLDPGTRGFVLLARGFTLVVLVGALHSLATSFYRVIQPATEAPVLAALPAAAPSAVPTPLPPSAGVTPDAVWLVERGRGFELLSNGLRIDTEHAVAGEARGYTVFSREGAALPGWRTQAAGILYHTSESDIWPLEAAYNESLRDSTQRLLRYLRRNHVYHYLIDRFGQVFRVVEEDGKANHAGNSVWEHDGAVYLNLNHAFIAVAFETRWEGGHALPITQAQFAAGRSLTEYLRQRHAIPVETCVTHGLTSVNPRKRLIGHHVDWARGFPFAAFGLPDQYAKPAPAVALFGFVYDGDFLALLGEPWPGVPQAERELQEAAARRGLSLEQVRGEKQRLYDRLASEQARLAADAGARASGAGERRNQSGG